MKRIRALPLKQKYFVPVRAEIMRVLDELIYAPLLALFAEPEELKNANPDPLTAAVENGTVYYQDGVFLGGFNSKISRAIKELGGVYNKRRGGWMLSHSAIPTNVRIAQANADQRYQRLTDAMIQTLDTINVESIDEVSALKDKYAQSIEWMNDDFQKAVSSVSVPPALTVAQTEIIATEWATNLDLYIQNWASENILKLRQTVAVNAFDGRRAADLVKMIKDNYGVGQRKAEFLARQETSLLMSKFHESRFRDIGSTGYIWEGSNDERERPDHYALNGKQFSWDSPPVTDKRTGARNHPGEDFNCRCTAIALLP